MGLLLETLLAFGKALVPIVRSGHVQSRIATRSNSSLIHRRVSIKCGIRKRAKENSLSDSHGCEKLPSRGAVEVERCYRDAR